MSIGVNEALFARSGKVLVLKQELMMSVTGSTRKLPAVFISFGGNVIMRFINFNTSVVVISEKRKAFRFFRVFSNS